MQIDTKLLLQLLYNIKRTQQYPPLWRQWIQEIDKDYQLLSLLEEHLSNLEPQVGIYQLLPSWTDDNNAYWGSLVTLSIYLFKEQLQEKRKAPTHIKGDYDITSATIIEGDLVVEGNLSTAYLENNAISLVVVGDLMVKGNYSFDAGSLIVLGDVWIEGSLNEKSDWSLTIIGGDCQVQQFIKSSGELFVQGKTISPLIYVSYNHGHCLFNKGFAALYFQESDHGGSYTFGEYEAPFIRIDEMRGIASVEVDQQYIQLKEILQPQYLEELADVDLENYDKEEFYNVEEFLEMEEEFELEELLYKLLEALEAGKSVFKPVIFEEWKNNFFTQYNP